MLYPELLKNTEFLDSKVWRLYLLLKSLCEFFLSPEKSDYQIDIQTKTLHEYLDIRLSLIDDSSSEFYEKPISPKHTFSLHYAKIERTVGCLANLDTNR